LYIANSPPPGTPESITIGVPPNEASALIYIAADRRLFAANGINVTIKNCTTALTAINAMKNGEVDISVSSEYPIVTEVYNKENISVIGCIDKHDTVYIIGRKDHGIETVSDLKGKRIGVPRGTIGEFYTGRFLDLNGIGLQDAVIEDVQQSRSMDAIANGSIDAILVRQAYDCQVKEFPESNYVVWPAQNGQASFMVMTCRDDWAGSHREPINRLLTSLAQAEEFVINHPAEAKSIVKVRLNYSIDYTDTIWKQNQYSLTLDQSLVLAMEDEGRWMIANNLTAEKKIPDYRDYFYTKGLTEVKPEAVNIC